MLKKRYRPLEPKTIHLKLSGELAQLIEHYRAFYFQTYHDEILEKELIVDAVEQFMEHDQKFQQYCKQLRGEERLIQGNGKVQGRKREGERAAEVRDNQLSN